MKITPRDGMMFRLKLYGLTISLDMILPRYSFWASVWTTLLTIEVNLNAYKLAKKNDLSATMYHESMMDNNDQVVDKRMKAPKEIERYKFHITRA